MRRLPLGLSLVLHLLGLALLIFLGRTSDSERALPPNPQALQVRSLSEAQLKKELAEALGDKETQIVQTDERLKSEKAPETEEKVFLSQTNQSVDHNTRAARVGKFKNVLKEGAEGRSEKSGSSSSTAGAQKPVEAAKLFALAPSEKDLEQQQAGENKTGRLRTPASLPPNGGAGQGFSATDDYLEDVAVGANTLLNAREFKYYSFYERVRERLANEWPVRLNAEINQLLSKGKNIFGDRRTKVEVRLDERGQLAGLRILGSSGYVELDRAATEAFHLAAPFPNPPSGLVEKDHSVRIRWDFVVMGDDGSGVHFQIRRAPAGL